MDLSTNLDYDILSSVTITHKCRFSKVYAQNLYAALCNNTFYKGEEDWSCSWRCAGDIVAEACNNSGCYMDWYCSGMIHDIEGFVKEGTITDEIKLDLMRLGWTTKSLETVS